MKNNKKEELSLFKIIKRIIPMALCACPIYFIVINLVGILHGTSYGFNTFMNAKFVDSVTDAINLNTGATKVIIMAILLGLTGIMVQVLNGLHNFMTSNYMKIASGYLTSIINKKAAKISPLAYENKELLDDINKASQGMENSIFMLIILIMIFTFYIPYFLFMGIYLFTLKPILALSLVIIFIPVMISQIIRSMVFTKLEDKCAPLRREFNYYESCICSREMFKETRLLGAFSFFKKLYNQSINLLSKETWKAEKKTGLLELLMKFLTLLGYGGVLFLLVDALLKDDISVGAFAAVFNSIGAMFSIMEEIICRHIGDVTRNIGTVRNFIRFLDMPERGGSDKDISVSKGIELKNVSFSYPLANKKSIKDVSLKINSKETLAIIGMNGAGKSTLVKLLTGLYKPDTGSIKYNGVDIKNIASNKLYKIQSGVFQHFGKYKMTLGENITISDLNRQNGEPKEAANKADIDINSGSFPDGMITVLSKEFDGVDISGGQWQRVAIARGLYKEHELIVLDEPTSAIDPLEEKRIYEKFAEISKDVISIIVTHRLGSARIADRIIVLDDGEIVEVGSHDELVNKGGKYTEMWNSQAKYYV